MNHFEHIGIPDVFMATRYVFPERGDGIPMHNHDHSITAHWIYVESGSVQVYGRGKRWSYTLTAGERLHLTKAQQEHEIAALEPGTVIYNPRYETRGRLPPPELRRGEDHTPITEPL